MTGSRSSNPPSGKAFDLATKTLYIVLSVLLIASLGASYTLVATIAFLAVDCFFRYFRKPQQTPSKNIGGTIGGCARMVLRRNTENRVVVAVMGPTGSGKSSFIKRLTGSKDIIIGHGLTSATSKVECYELVHQNTRFILVDTPGFDDSSGLDTDIVQEILTWLKSSMGEGLLLNGLVYLHRIVDPRISGTARSNMRLFRELCGKDNLHNVVLATTFWGGMNETTGASRENQLLTDSKFWKPMADHGSRAFRLKEDRNEDLKILSHVASKHAEFLVQAQKEMRDGQAIHETSAAKAMNPDLERFKRECDERIAAERRRQQLAMEESDRRKREKHRKEQERIETLRRRALEKQRQDQAEKEKKQREEQEQKARLEKIKREADEKALREKRDAAEKLLRERQAQAARLRQYASHVCANFNTKRVCCSKCGMRLDWASTDGRYCYHCCFCNDNDRWYHCTDCGNECPNSNIHPPMKTRAVAQTVLTSLIREL